MRMPEEINRILTDRISTLLFCPTQNALINLEKEGYKSLQIKTVYSGDIMEDAAYYYEARAQKPKQLLSNISEFILVTIHRAENTDNPVRLKSIFNAHKKIAQKTTVITIAPKNKIFHRKTKYKY